MRVRVCVCVCVFIPVCGCDFLLIWLPCCWQAQYGVCDGSMAETIEQKLIDNTWGTDEAGTPYLTYLFYILSPFHSLISSLFLTAYIIPFLYVFLCLSPSLLYDYPST